MIWKCISHAMTGASHVSVEKGCEDIVLSSLSEDAAILVLTDGAGSAAFAKEGAKTAAKACMRCLKRLGISIFQLPEETIKSRMITSVTRSLNEVARKKKVGVKDLSSTLLFLITDSRDYIYGHIGDGVIGGTVGEESLVISLPERGEFANNTFFTTSPEKKKHLRIHRGQVGGADSFFLMSDGSADCLFDPRTSEFAPAVNKFSLRLKNTSPESVPVLEERLIDFMENHFKKLTNDDCSIVMLRWEN